MTIREVFLNYNGNQCPQYVVMLSVRFISSTIDLNLKERITQHQYLYKFMTTHTASSDLIVDKHHNLSTNLISHKTNTFFLVSS